MTTECTCKECGRRTVLSNEGTCLWCGAYNDDPEEKYEERSRIFTEYHGLDYDLFVINGENQDSTPEQIRDCIHDALTRIDERLKALEDKTNG